MLRTFAVAQAAAAGGSVFTVVRSSAHASSLVFTFGPLWGSGWPAAVAFATQLGGYPFSSRGMAHVTVAVRLRRPLPRRRFALRMGRPSFR